MNLTDYTYIINKPDAINERHYLELEKISEDFPYFQSSRVLQLKHLYNQDSFKYNQALKITASYTTDRGVLFDFITNPQFATIQNGLYEKKIAQLMNIEVVESHHIVAQNTTEKPLNTLKNSLKQTIQNATKNNERQSLEIGKPLNFLVSEKHSFQEWLQLSQVQPIDRSQRTVAKKLSKIELIDNFIENNPKIPPISKNNITTFIPPSEEEKTYLMTETLAKVYLEQKKYSKAIQAYQILILKYPEKSSLFANQIENIKKIQQNNNF